MKKILLLVLLLCVGCQVSTEFYSPLYLPTIIDGPEPHITNKKGVSLGSGGCELLRALGVSWYYTGQECEGYEQVPYLDTAYLLEQAPSKRRPDAEYVMFLNECDLGRWGCPAVSEQVRLFIEAEDAWEGIVWVGPCSSGSTQYVSNFWLEYWAQTGHLPDPDTHRACVHCYGDAPSCIERTQSTLWATKRFGIVAAWVTEFGMTLGTTRSIQQVAGENAAFVSWMEQTPSVERYAYWTAKIGHYGWTIPSKPISGFHPLAFDWLNKDGSVAESLTDMGEWYVTAPQPAVTVTPTTNPPVTIVPNEE